MKDHYYIDTHCHLQDERIGRSFSRVIAAAETAGVHHMVCCGTQERDWARVLQLARQYKTVWPCLGIHPWYIRCCRDGWQQRLKEALPYIAGIGEVGLDVAVDGASQDEQERVFLEQLELAYGSGKPISIHCRKAWGRLMEILKDAPQHPAGLVFHAYSGSAETAEKLLPKNAYFSFGGAITFAGNKKAPRILNAIPADRLLAESDAPDMRPEGLPTKRAEGGGLEPADFSQPAHLPFIVEKMAAILHMDVADVADILYRNAMRVFAG